MSLHNLQNNQVTSINYEFKQLEEIGNVVKELAIYPNLQKLSLHGNRIRKQTKDFGRLRKLRFLDISGNLISDINDAIFGLKALPNLRELKINTNGKTDEDFLQKELPRLQLLNGSRVVDNGGKAGKTLSANNNKTPSNTTDKENQNPKIRKSAEANNNKKQPLPDFKIENEDLQKVAALFDCVRIIFKDKYPVLDKELSNELDEHIKNVMVDLGVTLNGNNIHPSIVATHNLKARFAQEEQSFCKQIEYTKLIDPRLSELLEAMHDSHAKIFKQIVDVIFDIEPKSNVLYEDYRQRSKQAYQDTENVLESADKLYVENQEIIQSWESDKKNWDVERERLQGEIVAQENENKRYLDKILKHSKEIAHDVELNADPNDEYNQEQEEDGENHHQSPKSWENNSRMEKGGSGMRNLSLKQLKELINEIYDSKQKYDHKYAESKLPRETMEQHMYTFLNTKYGLKSLIIEWASALINGIKKYNSLDNDVAVFGKILRNECDEEFKFVQAQVKTTIRELLKMLIKGKFPYKNKNEIKDQLDSKLSGLLLEEEACEIVRYMYSQEDSETILASLGPDMTMCSYYLKDRRITREERNAQSKEESKMRIEFVKFEKVILDFQLKSHEKFLNKFIQIFKKVDKDQNGIIEEKELRGLIKVLDPQREFDLDVEELLELLDPFSNNIITFSSCITLLSSKIITWDNKQLSILHKLSLEEEAE